MLHIQMELFMKHQYQFSDQLKGVVLRFLRVSIH